MRAQAESSAADESRKAERAWVHLAPVESMLEGDAGVTAAISAKEGMHCTKLLTLGFASCTRTHRTYKLGSSREQLH